MRRCAPAPAPDLTGGSAASSKEAAWRSCLLQLWIRIAHGRKIRCARAGVQFTQDRIVALLRLPFGDAAVRIVGIAEDDRFAGAGRFTSRDDFAVANRTILFFGIRSEEH